VSGGGPTAPARPGNQYPELEKNGGMESESALTDVQLMRALADFTIAHPELPSHDALTLYHAIGIIAGIAIPPAVRPA
jgi:hypothetical protein